MKQLVLILTICFSTYSFSQVVLTKKSHGLATGTKNDMKIIEYIEPGISGKGIVWDFTKIVEKANFTGSLDETYVVPNAPAIFTQSNVALEEFNNKFIFNVTETGIEQEGYISSNGKTYLKYSKAFVKMQYPFTYGNSFSGECEADFYNDNVKGSGFKGTYEVSADGLGTLLFPNGVSYKNVLRVKEVKKSKYNQSNTVSEDVTYRWYIQQHRYPVLVVIKSGISGSNNSTTLAAYNPSILIPAEKQTKSSSVRISSVFPNPASDVVTIAMQSETEGTATISLYDASGKLLRALNPVGLNVGAQEIKLSVGDWNLAKGVYYLKLMVDSNEFTEKIEIQ